MVWYGMVWYGVATTVYFVGKSPFFNHDSSSSAWALCGTATKPPFYKAPPDDFIANHLANYLANHLANHHTVVTKGLALLHATQLTVTVAQWTAIYMSCQRSTCQSTCHVLALCRLDNNICLLHLYAFAKTYMEHMAWLGYRDTLPPRSATTHRLLHVQLQTRTQSGTISSARTRLWNRCTTAAATSQN
ncbi:hypothetical protein VOLCADRAFT_90369 [Volvox carteri f. nagariensis]|uniref:Uncharacterized protein n=1 Tax=Volvox carteri f. nagariensis TaxID=3068 RepID=D8TU69_VOLCA|nr:uncharacterized protein VOLCADRAFT_90369 [Volvox carteri f. nagariensis]EFJ48984.1 hypothetical protein VOLCADRAFT_90369 [Volvox carteri f. nagariensis]|eukprot:XP_002949881.1 hypothetical protein VOLCADRAFT_90369 [Volvox carteri f. nagariensis]